MSRIPSKFSSAWRLALLGASLSLLLSATSARATTVLDTFGPGDTSAGQIWSLYNDPDSTYIGQSLAVPFSLASSTTIDSILTSISGAGTFSLYIVADASGLPTGSVLYTTTLTNPIPNVLVSGIGVTLSAGSYWLASKASLGSNGTWQGGDTTGTNLWAFTFEAVDTPWVLTGPDDAPAARITAVPEPGTWVLMLGGFALLGWQARRRAG